MRLCEHGVMSGPYFLRGDLDRRLLAFAERSWNAYQAVYALQQFGALIPAYCKDLEATFGPHGIGEPRRAWGVMADLIAAMTGLPPTLETVAEMGFAEVRQAGHIIEFGGDFALANSPALRELVLPLDPGIGIDGLLQTAAKHDRAARKLLDDFREEVRSYDIEICELANACQTSTSQKEVQTFFHLLRSLDSVPNTFPLWDGRPMFLDEQRGFLDYIAKFIGAEVVAEAMVDEQLGQYLLRRAGYLNVSSVPEKTSYAVERIPPNFLELPVSELAFRTGHAALSSLRMLAPSASMFERFYAVEESISSTLGLDVSPVFADARDHMITAELQIICDQGAPMPYEFPELKEKQQ